MTKQISKQACIFFFFLAIATFRVLSNGGPYDGSGIYSSGDPHFLHIHNVELLSEKLDMKINGNYTEVHVTYRLLNSSAKSTGNISYGFPVEYVEMESCGSEWNKDYLKSIQFKFNGKPLKTKNADHCPEPAYVETEKNKIVIGDWESSNSKRKWFYTEFSINANDLISLEVIYQVENNYEDWSTSKSHYPGFGTRQLVYDFSPAAYWGDGIVKDFQVNIDANFIQKPDTIHVEGLNFKYEDGIYRFSKANFDLKKTKPLLISYDISGQKFTELLKNERIPKKLITSVKSSGTLTGNYGVENLLDGNLSTAWAEGASGNGVGEWIEFTFAKNAYVGAIQIINGYVKSSGTYYENNRIKKLKLDIEYFPGDHWPTEPRSEIIELEDLKYENGNLSNFISLASNIFDGGDAYHQISKMKITILDVFKGSKFNDTCISEFFVLGGNMSDIHSE